MESKKEEIAISLAKFELDFNEKEDKNNQDKLRKLTFKRDQIFEEVNSFTQKAIAIIAEANPGVQISPELELGIILSLEKQIEEGKITSVAQMISSNDVLGRVTNDIVSSDKYYTSNSTTYEQNTINNVAVGTIAGITITEFMSKDMTQEEILKFEEEFKNSAEYKQAATSSMDNLFGAKTQEEKQKAATEVGLRDIGTRSRDYRVQNKGTKADRATLMLIARKVATGNPELAKEAAIEAKLCGFEHLVGRDGTFDLEKIHGAFVESLGDDTRFSSFETFMERIQDINEKSSGRIQEKYKNFEEKYISMQTTEDKMSAINEREQQQARTYAVIAELSKAVKEQNTEQIDSLMQEFTALNTDLAKKVLLNIASKDNTAIHVKGQIIDFANERFSEEKSKEVPESPNKDDGWEI